MRYAQFSGVAHKAQTFLLFRGTVRAKLRHWSFLAKARVHSKRRFAPFFAVCFAALAVAAAVAFFSVGQAQGSGQEDPTTLGLGSSRAQAAESQQLTSAQRASGITDASSSVEGVDVSEAVDATEATQRSITVKDPDPVVVPIAIDGTNPQAMQKASEVCTLDPLPTAPRVAPDVNDGTWQSGIASAYSIETNDDGQGNFGVTDTASGIALTHSSITVAVPEDKSYLVGSVCEICYNGKVVIATVTDTGGFAKYGRALDLAPGVYKAFGASGYSDWGTRTVYYRFI